LANPSKKLAIKRLIETIKPSIILLQEIMTDGEKITSGTLKNVGWVGIQFYRCHWEIREGTLLGGRNAPIPLLIHGIFLQV
jgi:hypothetical protein